VSSARRSLPIHRREFRAELLLLLAALVWGLGFVAQRIGTESVPPFAFNAIRFGLGATVLLPLVILRRNLGWTQGHAGQQMNLQVRSSWMQRLSSKAILWGGGVLAGLLVAIAVNFQQFGIHTTTAGKTGFITGLYMVLVPLLGLFIGHRPGWGSWLGAGLSTLGLFFLSVQSNFTIAPGDFLVLACAVTFAFQVLLVGWLSPRVDPLELSLVEFAACALFCSVGALAFESLSWGSLRAGLGPLLYAGLGSVAIGYTLQIIGQRNANPTHASIIMNMESLFAVIGGWLILSEVLSGRALLGCVLMFAGILLAQLKP
jgi:drug/metabolite transporter (DMT)-like permease